MTTRKGRGGTKVPAQLVELARDFEIFRSSGGVGQRIPAGLRERVLRALESGAPEPALYRACGLTRNQVSRWAAASTDSRAGSRPASRVLRVVPEVSTSSGAAAVAVELRVGPWRLQLLRGAC